MSTDLVMADELVRDSRKSTIVWNDDDVEMVLCADDEGNVCLRDFVRLLTSTSDANAQQLETMIPDLVVGIDDFSTRLLVAGIDVGLKGSGSMQVVQDDRGRSLLRMRCDLKFLRTARPYFTPTIDLDQPTRNSETESTIVLFIHGIRGNPKSFDAARNFLRKSGTRTGSIHYDDHQEIARSARQIADAVNQQFASDRSARLVIVGHSMGGLIAREWIENPGLNSLKISRLITVATPHGGSSWAQMTPFSDVFISDELTPESLLSLVSKRSSIASARDLRPDSPFLKTLRSRPLRKDIRYTTIVGLSSPIDAETVSFLKSEFADDSKQPSATPDLSLVQQLLQHADEICDGKGDGLVAVEEAKMVGVDDIVYVNLTHWTLFAPLDGGAINPVWQAVADRVSQIQKRP